ncbi:tigger transposable element-derived protein 6-like protein [Elysia marginata]|uniref:Tigger transposable element-derived protein 6-like protein n=1 Tax=Elysia marginata TaxID=1093978 RepID=A0AAV4ELG2_9GAST|nr:tigger transposable element-derived protein 6-like protein [Elysia marginata]
MTSNNLPHLYRLKLNSLNGQLRDSGQLTSVADILNFVNCPVPAGEIVMVQDFAENRKAVYAEEIKSAHFGKNQISVHPMMAFYRKGDEVMRHCILAFSDDIDRDYHPVNSFTIAAIEMIRQRGTFNKLSIWSDGCASHLARAMGRTSKSKDSTPLSASGGYCHNYTYEDLQWALQAVKAGTAISAAARENNIPRITLHDYVLGKSSLGKQASRAPGIPADIEDQIVQKVVLAAETGFPITKMQLLSKVGRLVKRLNLRTQFKDGVPSNEYWRSLKKRYPQVTIQAPEACASKCLHMLNEVTVGRYFDDLGRLLDKLGLKKKPSQIWNCDETGLQFTHNPSLKIAKKGSRTLHARASNSKENVTVLACINALGSTMPPMCFVKGKTVKSVHGFATHDTPKDIAWTFQESAWMCDVLGLSPLTFY